MKRLSVLLLLPLLVTFGGPAGADALPETAPPADVRVLIDVSGSMKKNDPGNLRRAALDLLVRLFPADTRAGVWSFGHDVHEMVPLGTVDDEWREEGKRRAQRIHSTELHTDIPAALAAATADDGRADGRRISLLLLTDGMVDVAKAAEINAAARQQLIDEVAPRLRALGIRVHTVALSDEADHELLERLALITEGVYAVARDATELQRIFVQALDAAAPSEQLPLTDNRFLVDSAVNELTALVFHDGAPLVLVAPDGGRHAASDHGRDMNWHQGHGYELVTITRPYEGEWKLEGEAASGSRVTIVSDLSLVATRLPDNLFPGEPPMISALLREGGEPLARPELEALIEFSAVVTREATAAQPAEQWHLPLQREGAAWSASLPMLAGEPGRYELTVIADGNTFRRSQRQALIVRDHFQPQVLATDEIPARHRLLLRVVNPALSVDTVTARATVRSGSGGRAAPQPVSLQPLAEGDGWQLLLDASVRQEVEWEAEFTMPGSADTSAVWRSGVIVLEEGAVSRAPVPPLQLSSPADATHPVEEPVAVEPPPPAPASAPAERPWLLYGTLIAGNLLLAGLALFAYRKIMGGDSAPVSSAETVTPAAGEPAGPEAVSTPPPLDGLELPLDAIDLDPDADRR
ncbi:MAG: vWA domain-containing protein [Spongiibacteraceae bacterium]|nr:vWA domain-containing protein [Spongiibacteraceae bacterium]